MAFRRKKNKVETSEKNAWKKNNGQRKKKRKRISKEPVNENRNLMCKHADTNVVFSLSFHFLSHS